MSALRSYLDQPGITVRVFWGMLGIAAILTVLRPWLPDGLVRPPEWFLLPWRDWLDVAFDLFPEGKDAARLDGRPVAVCRFAPGGVAEPALFEAIPHRRSRKEPSDMTRPVETGVLEDMARSVALGSGVAFTNAPNDVQRLRVLTRDAFVI